MTAVRRCPDGGFCHHDCPVGQCFRVDGCGPLSGVYPGDEWPASIRMANRRGDLVPGPILPREWVVGFLLDDDSDQVVLIRKNRPEWQAGKLNGVGGKVEPGESLAQAMVREFREETGVWIKSWEPFARLRWAEGVVHFYRAFRPYGVLAACRTMTDESIERHRVHTLGLPGPGRENVIPNLLWLVPLAAHRHDRYDVIDVAETGATLPKPGRLEIP